MGLGEKLLNAITGSNVRTIKVSAEQLAAIINDTFIVKTTTRAQREEIERTIKGSKIKWSELDSLDGKFHLHVSEFRRGLTEHRTVWVKNYETEEVYEWSGFTLGALRSAVEPYLLQASVRQ